MVLTVFAVILAGRFVQSAEPRAGDANAFVARAESELADHSVLANRANWINGTYITEDTDIVAAEIGARGTELSVRFASALRDRLYTLQAATNLSPPVVWEPISTQQPDENYHCIFTITNMAGPERYFRVYGIWP